MAEMLSIEDISIFDQMITAYASRKRMNMPVHREKDAIGNFCFTHRAEILQQLLSTAEMMKQITKLQAELDQMEIDMETADREYNELNRNYRTVSMQLEAMKSAVATSNKRKAEARMRSSKKKEDGAVEES